LKIANIRQWVRSSYDDRNGSPTPERTIASFLFVNRKSITDDEVSIKCVSSSIN
jgi:hypothetical protein